MEARLLMQCRRMKTFALRSRPNCLIRITTAAPAVESQVANASHSSQQTTGRKKQLQSEHTSPPPLSTNTILLLASGATAPVLNIGGAVKKGQGASTDQGSQAQAREYRQLK
eukprot:1145118-Pelagomonas_calceolata.AAC.2